ncbi:transmembrane protein 126A [Xenentodon cancila]
MSEDTEQRSGSRDQLTSAVVSEMLINNFEKLPDVEQKLFVYGPLYLGGNAALGGLISNSLFRRALNIIAARFASSLPMAVLPFMTTYGLYNAAVCKPLLSGDLNCPTCSLLRGAAVGVVGGGLYPLILALPLNLALASRYNSALLPEKGNLLRFCAEVSRPVFNKMRAVMLLQAVCGTYLGSRHFEGFTKLTQITFGKSDEQLQD